MSEPSIIFFLIFLATRDVVLPFEVPGNALFKSLPSGAPCFVFSHHGFVFGDGVGGAVTDVFPRGRKSMAEGFEEAVGPRQIAHLKMGSRKRPGAAEDRLRVSRGAESRKSS